MNENVYFKPRARLMNQLGEQLIKNESIALLELVKNSYDADAKNVKVTMSNIDQSQFGSIIIEDDGEGMDINTVKDVWMVLGTDSKKKKLDKMIKNKERSPLGRLPMGEKGIGRFGAHKLGHKISLISRMANSREVVVDIDWLKFDNYDYLEDVPLKIMERNPEYFFKNKTGTKIIITKLKTEWSRGKMREVYRSLNALNSPFDSLSSFKVKFITTHNEWLEGLLNHDDIKDYSLFEAEIKLSGNKIIRYDYNFRPWPSLTKLENRHNFRENIEMVIEKGRGRNKKLMPIDLSKYKIGDIKIKIMIFDLDSTVLSYGVSDKKGLRDYLMTNGGIYVYRDGIRVYEYGESGNDWLMLEAKRINAPSTTLSSKIVIGAVYLDRETSEGLEEKTNREGFIENEAFTTFRNAVVFAIEKIQTERTIDKDLLRKYYGPTNKSEPVMSSIEDIREKVSKKIKDEKLQKELYNCLDNIENDYKYISDVYIRSSNSGLSLSIVIHEIQKIIYELRHAIKNEEASNHIKNLISDLAKVTDGYAEIIRNKKKTFGNIVDILNNAIFNIKYRLRAHQVEVVDGYSKYSKNTKIKCVENLVLGTIMNIIDNSIWWTTYAKVKNKKIYLGISDEIDGYKSIILADNGKGYTLPTEQIVKPFISDRPGGMGLGLHLANEVMNAHGGKLMFPDEGEIFVPVEFRSGAITILAFKGENQ